VVGRDRIELSSSFCLATDTAINRCHQSSGCPKNCRCLVLQVKLIIHEIQHRTTSIGLTRTDNMITAKGMNISVVKSD